MYVHKNIWYRYFIIKYCWFKCVGVFLCICMRVTITRPLGAASLMTQSGCLLNPSPQNISGPVSAGKRLQSDMCTSHNRSASLWLVCSENVFVWNTLTNVLVCCVVFRQPALTWSGSCQQLCMWFWGETCPWTADSTPGCWVRNTHTDTILTRWCIGVYTHHVVWRVLVSESYFPNFLTRDYKTISIWGSTRLSPIGCFTHLLTCCISPL